MDIKECFDKFLEFSLISYDSFETIFNNQDAVYKEFTHYAISYCGQNKETIDKFFYDELIPACKEWIMDENWNKLTRISMTDKEYKQLAKLVTYLLESEDWKYIWLNEYAEPIRLFMFKTGITFRKTKKYIDKAMNKLLGPEYNNTQSRLKQKIDDGKDLLYKPKPKPKQIKTETKTLVPWSEFGRKYLEHYGYGSARNRNQYERERKFFKSNGYATWEVEK